MNPAYLRMSATLTEFVRHDQSDLATALRKALTERHIEAESSVIADFCPESSSLADGAPYELHHLVVVDCHRDAFVGMLHRTASSAYFDQWRVVPSVPIVEREAIVRALNENRRARRDWNAGIDPSITDPKDVIYNELIEAALAILDRAST